MNINEQVAALEKNRGELIAALEALVTKSTEENRDFDEAEQAKYDSIKAEIASADKRLIALRDVQALVATKAKTAGTEDKAKAGEGARVKDNRPLSCNIARGFLHLVRAGGNHAGAYELAKAQGDIEGAAILAAAMGPEVFKATAMNTLVTTSATDAAALVRDSWGEFFDLLRPQTIVGRLNSVQRVDFTGVDVLKLQSRTTGSTGGWVGQAKPIPVSTNVFTTTSIAPYKLGVILPASKELFQRSNPSAEMLLRDDMLAACAKALDTKFISTDAASAGVSPAGIMNGVAGAYTYASAGLTVANVTTDLMKARKQFASVDQPGPFILVCDPTFVEFARALRDANSNFVFKDELDRGTIYGLQVVESTVVTDTVLNILAAPDIIVGTGFDTRIELSTEALVQLQDDPTDPIDVSDDGATSVSKLISAFQSEIVLLKVVMGATWAKRRTSAVVQVTGGTWAS